jgi:cyclopropane-fatty-acyl-phospholipid synthase
MDRNAIVHRFERLLALADVEIGGKRPWDIHVHNQGLYTRVLTGGSLALGQSYMDGWWDCPRLDDFFYRTLRAQLDTKAKPRTWLIDSLKARLFNRQKPSRAYQVGAHHYDIDIHLYRHMLDNRLIYSCGFWETATTLEAAQESKLNLVCRKLDLQPGMRVLDIGCGWGGTAKFIAERFDVEVVGITVSGRQAAYAKELCRGFSIDIRLQDYRKIDETFDRVLSIGMLEHVGDKNYVNFMRIVRNSLKDDESLFLLHTIGTNKSDIVNDPWIERYIFPNSMLPSARQICAATEGVFVLEDWHSFGPDYDRTLMQWFRNFHDNWDVLCRTYDERFYRMWKYYLLSCAGSFRARKNQLWQLVLSPKGMLRGYRTQRHYV